MKFELEIEISEIDGSFLSSATYTANGGKHGIILMDGPTVIDSVVNLMKTITVIAPNAKQEEADAHHKKYPHGSGQNISELC